MNKDDMIILNEFNSEEYNYLTNSVGWGEKNLDFVTNSLKQSKFLKAIKYNNKIIGMGQAIGNGMAYIIADVVVHPDYCGKGIGKTIVLELLKDIENELPTGCDCSVSLISASGKEEFYEKCGFIRTPFSYNGSGMKLKITK